MTEFLDAYYRTMKEQATGIPATISSIEKTDVDILRKKNLVVLVGAGDSFAVAEYGKWAFLSAGINAVSFSPAEIERIELNDKTLVVGITASGRSLSTIRALEYAKSHRSDTVVLTDNKDGKAVEVADSVWLTKSGVDTYNIAPSSPTTCAMVYLLKTVALEESTGHSRIGRDCTSLGRASPQIVAWAETMGKDLAEYIDLQRGLYIISEGPQNVAAQIGMMKLNEFSLLKATPVAREEFQHHYNLITKDGDCTVVICDEFTRDTDDAYIDVIQNTLKLQVFRLVVPESLCLESDLGQTIVSTIAFQMAAYYTVLKHSPNMEWFRLPNAKAFKIY